MATLSEFLAAHDNARRNGEGYLVRCRAHEDRQNSLSVKQADGKLLVKCFAGCTAEAVVAAIGWSLKDLFVESKPTDDGARLVRRRRPVTTTWEVRDWRGELRAIHERTDPGKHIVWKGPDGSIGLNGTPTPSLPLYGSQATASWDLDVPVVLCEGERATDAVLAAGLPAVGTVCGASAIPDADSLAILAGHHVTLWPDNDEPGRTHMARIAAALRDVAAELRVVSWPDAPDKGDAADVGDVDVLRQLVAAAVPHAAPEPAADLASLLDEVESFVRRFVAFQNTHQSAACALWLAHCHAIDAAPMAGYLHVTSAVQESGKTTLIESMQLLLGPRGLNAVSASPAAIFRMRDRSPVALLLDEIDNTVKDRKDDGARDVLALINAGYRRGATVLRVVGQNHEPKQFQVFGPVALAGIGSLHATTESRCIPIVLERKKASSLEPWISFRHEPRIAELRGQLATWANEAVPALRQMNDPQRPDAIRDRHYEVWWGMLSIAELAGERWAARARLAASSLHAARGDEVSSLGELLLKHIQQAFGEQDRLSTVQLLSALVANEEGPWGRWWGREVNKGTVPSAAAGDLAAKLRPFGVKPRVVRIGDATPRGYLREDFASAFALYVAVPPATAATAATNESAESVLSTNTGVNPVAPVAPVAGGTGSNGDAVHPMLQAVLDLTGGELVKFPGRFETSNR